MRRVFPVLIAFVVLLANSSAKQRSYWVATGQAVSPNGAVLSFFGKPVDMCRVDTRTVAIKSSHSIVFVDTQSFIIVKTLAIPNPRIDYAQDLGSGGAFGIFCDSRKTEVWVTDAFGWLRSIARVNGHWEWRRAFRLPSRQHRILANTAMMTFDEVSAPLGIDAAPDGNLYVALSRLNQVALVSRTNGRILRYYDTGVAPYEIISSNGKLYVTNWGGVVPGADTLRGKSSGTFVAVDRRGVASSGSVSILSSGTQAKAVNVRVGRHPSAMVLSRKRHRLYVANANDDTISVIDTRRNIVVTTFRLSQHSAIGRMPNALALAPDERRLYVALGGENAVAILDAVSGQREGTLTTGWFPSAVVTDGTGAIEVASLKGLGSGMDAKGGYNVFRFLGAVQKSSLGDATRYSDETPNVRSRPSALAHFHHVMYIIKENHTYDDFFGDMPEGDGDRRYCVFPDAISPNHHALARQFGLFDRFFVNGTVSGDGHNWTDEDEATDYVERESNGFPRSYPSAGNDALAYAGNGFIWTRVLDAGLSFLDYGEFFPDTGDLLPADATWTSMYQRYLRGEMLDVPQRVLVQSLVGHVRKNYPSFALQIPDQYRASIFIDDLHRFERDNDMPDFIMLQLPNDHTAGGAAGYPRPLAEVADNDLALGRIVEAVSHSRFWDDTLILVVEDDAQDGIDHVDGHRTMALVISAYNTPHFVSHESFNQSSIIRTIDDIFNLPPLTFFDAIATPIVSPFTSRPEQGTYTHRMPAVRLDEMSGKSAFRVDPRLLGGPDRLAAPASAPHEAGI